LLRAGGRDSSLRRSQLARKSKRSFPAGRLVAVLLADDQHRGFSVANELGASHGGGPREDDERNGAALLRAAEHDETGIARARGDALDKRDHLVLAREVFAARLERRRRNVGGGIGKAGGDGRRLDVLTRRIERRMRRNCAKEQCRGRDRAQSHGIQSSAPVAEPGEQ
jgi:hypothetical protein